MDELTAQVNLALDRVKAEQGLTEGALARHLGCSRNTLYRWRGGDFSAVFRAIIPITALVNTPVPESALDAIDVRILAPLLTIPQIDT